MAIKLLRGQEETAERNGVKVTIKVVDMATQAAISDLSIKEGFENNVRLLGFMLRNVITDVEVDGDKYSPSDLLSANIADAATLKSIMNILTLALNMIFPPMEEVEKEAKK